MHDRGFLGGEGSFFFWSEGVGYCLQSVKLDQKAKIYMQIVSGKHMS